MELTSFSHDVLYRPIRAGRPGGGSLVSLLAARFGVRFPLGVVISQLYSGKRFNREQTKKRGKGGKAGH